MSHKDEKETEEKKEDIYRFKFKPSDSINDFSSQKDKIYNFKIQLSNSPNNVKKVNNEEIYRFRLKASNNFDNQNFLPFNKINSKTYNYTIKNTPNSIERANKSSIIEDKKSKISDLINDNKKKELKKNYISTINNPKEDILVISKDDFTNFCHELINLIKEKIGVLHDDFEKYIEEIKIKNVNVNKIIDDVLSENILKILFEKTDIKKNTQNYLQAKRCAQVITLALLKCSDYISLRNSLKILTGLNKRYLYDLIKKYVIILNYINPNVRIDNWLPRQPFEYDYPIIKEMVRERNWKLIYPTNQVEFNKLKIQYNCEPARVPLKVDCDRGHIFYTNAFNLYRRERGCRKCATEDNIKYDIQTINELVNKKGWILKYPKTQEQFEALRKEHNCASNEVPLMIECKLRHIILTTAHRLQQKLLKDTEGCLLCSYIKKTKYNFDTILDLIRDMGYVLITPKSQEEFQALRAIKKCKPMKVPLKLRCNRNHVFFSNATRLQQKIRCPHCRERKTAIGTIFHPILEYYTIKSLLLKNCQVNYEHFTSSITKQKVDIIIKRNKTFIENIEKFQNIINFPKYIYEITVDFTFSITKKFILKKFFKNYQNEERFLIVVLLNEEKEKSSTIYDIEQIIQLSDMIKFKDHIKIIPFFEFLKFLNLSYNWRSLSNDENIILSNFMKMYELAINSIDSDEKFKELIKISEKCKSLL